MSTRFEGLREAGVCSVYLVEDGGATTLASYFDEPSQSGSPWEWDWGQESRGASLLAGQLLWVVTGDRRIAVALFAWFAKDVVSRLPRETWVLWEEEILGWMEWQSATEQLQPPLCDRCRCSV